MKSHLKLVIFFMSVLVCAHASANSPFSTSTISGIVVHDGGNEIFIELSSTVTNSENCSINNQLALKKTHPFFKEMFSALLSAFHAGTPIQGWVNTCHQFNMPVLTRLDLKK